MTRRSRLFLTFVLAILAMGLTAPSVAAVGPRFPTQSIGNRGADVRAIQLLLTDRGFPVTDDGVFGETTRDAIKAWKDSVALTGGGIVDDAAWAKLIRMLRSGDEGPAVEAVQRQLRAKRNHDVPLDGIYGESTRQAVRAFQRHERIMVTGTMNGRTWRALIAHFELPSFNKTSLCDYSVGNGPANWGTSAAINQLEAAARIVARKGLGRVAVGDISLQHPGNIPLHESHERGLDADVRLMRKAEDQCRWGGSYRSSAYDRAATRYLIRAILATAPGHVKLIYFNDPVLIREGLTRRHAGHDDHLHIRYCEKTHPVKSYDC